MLRLTAVEERMADLMGDYEPPLILVKTLIDTDAKVVFASELVPVGYKQALKWRELTEDEMKLSLLYPIFRCRAPILLDPIDKLFSLIVIGDTKQDRL